MPKYRKFYVKSTESWDINDMPDDFTRLLWVMLPLGLCREGRGVDNPAWIKAKIMPLRMDVTAEMIDTAMGWYVGRGMVERYEVKGRKFFYIPTWHDYQGTTIKEADSIYPAPPQEQPQAQSGASPEPVQSRSGTDSHVDSDSQGDVDSLTPSGENPPQTEPETDDPIDWNMPEQVQPKPKEQRLQEMRDAVGSDVLEGIQKAHEAGRPDEWQATAEAFCVCLHGIHLDNVSESDRRNWPTKLKTIAEGMGASSAQMIDALRVMPDKQSGVAFKVPGSYSSPYAKAFEPDIKLIIAKMAAGQIQPRGQKSKGWSKAL